MNLIFTLNKLWASIEALFLVFLICLMTLLTFTQVMLRNLGFTPFDGLDTLNSIFVMWIAFVGASLVYDRNHHMIIDAFVQYFPLKIKKLIQVLGHVILLWISYHFLKASYEFILSEKEFGGMFVWNIPSWFVYTIYLYGFFSLGFRSIIKILFFIFNQAK